MNHFFALVPDDETRERLQEVQRRLRAWELPARWVHPEDIHCTLVFCGRCDADEVAGLAWAGSEALEGWRPGAMHLPGLGGFGGKRYPRVVYAAVADVSGACTALHRALSALLGMDEERAFLPHCTLCRPRPGEAPGGRDWPQAFAAFGAADWGRCRFEALALYRSDPRRQVRYQALERWALE